MIRANCCIQDKCGRAKVDQPYAISDYETKQWEEPVIRSEQQHLHDEYF